MTPTTVQVGDTHASSDAKSSSPAADADIFAGYRREIDRLLDRYIPRDRPAALLQFPYDGNVGNHMMWTATCDYLEERGIPLRYVAHNGNFDVKELARAVGDGTVLFLGGVTISRLWPRHAEVKRAVARELPRNRLVSLPSTSLFVDDDDRSTAATIFGDHAHVTVMARDPLSQAQARAVFPQSVEVLTVPDLALRLPAQERRGTPTKPIIWLARGDIERLMGEPPKDVHVFDWPSYTYPEIPVGHYMLRLSGVVSRLRASPLRRVLPPSPLNQPICRLYRHASQNIIRYGNRVLDQGDVLVTDRMHPQMLAALRGQHAVVLPDKYGKNRAVYENFTRRFGTVHWANTPEEALATARALVRIG